MPEYRAPGAYVDEVEPRSREIEGVATAIAGFVGIADAGPLLSDLLTAQADFDRVFVASADTPLSQAVRAYFTNRGRRLYVARTADAAGVPAALDALATIDGIDIVAAPAIDAAAALIAHVEAPGRFRLALIDPPAGLDLDRVVAFAAQVQSSKAALYWPWVLDEVGTVVSPSGYVAAIISRTDQERGIWKAPANVSIAGVTRLQHAVTEPEQDLANPRGINCLRKFPSGGIRVWGARTLSADPDWTYIKVRRLNDWMEKSVSNGIGFAAFEPNGKPLWSLVQQLVENFLLRLWKDGALAGTKLDQAYFVRCDRTTMTQNDLDNGRLVVLVGIAPLRPAEFIVTRIEHLTADRPSDL